jgi:hypothetical protein
MATAAKRLRMSPSDYAARVVTDEKWCVGCKGWHPIDAFGSDASRGDGRAASCCRFRRARAAARREEGKG